MEVSLSPELEARLASLAARQGRDVGALAKEAIERLVDYDDWFLAEVAKGRAAAKRGDFIEHEERPQADRQPLRRLMRVRWTEPAVRDLTAICDYIEQHDSPPVARTVALRIVEGAESLVNFPRRGRPGSDPGTRELVLAGSPWLVIYSVNDDAVEILRILHGAQKRP